MSEKFFVGRSIGRGVVGTSYEGKLANGEDVVIKVVTRRFDDHDDLLKEVLKDIQIWSGFKHSNVAATLGLEEYQGRRCVLFEKAHGVNVQTYLDKQGPMPARVALRIVRDVAMGLAIAHERGLYSGDIRPSKIYFDEQRGAVITDLGLARASCLASGFGQSGLAFGHPEYLAPEILQEKKFVPSSKSDVYALGLTLYQMLVGHPPFQGSAQAVLEMHLQKALPPPPRSAEISPKLANVILAMTAKNPKKRLRNGKAVVNALYELLGRPAPFATGAGDVSVMTTSTWGRVASEDQAPPDMSESKIERALPVGPADIGVDRNTTGRLPKMLASGKFVRPQKGKADAKADPDAASIELGQPIGRGPVGTTYEGTYKGHIGEVVIKVITRRFSKHPELLKKILSQLKKAELLQDEGVLPVLKVLQVEGRDVVVMEKAEGRTLRQILDEEGPQKPPRALAWIKDLAHALDSAKHVGKGGFAHGDIRPEKIYIDPRLTGARLADYGFAEASCLAGNFGQFGMYFGHPAYVAPEAIQERRQKPDIASDIYALGIVLYEIVCGKKPFEGKNPKQTLMLHLKDPPPPPRSLQIPRPLAELMLRMISKSTDRRPRTPKELFALIERCQKQVLLTTGLRKVASVDEFNPSDSGEDIKVEKWEDSADEASEVTGSWSIEALKAINKIGPDDWQEGVDPSLLVSEELPPSDNPFAP